ncbi:cysteine hydrolase [bacterium]|nr:cysteine hydrolase [bacterium]MBU1883288.1 cysteine hydrolase [bacterium]
MKRALLVIDVQNEYFTGLMPVTYPQNSMPNILSAIKTAKEMHIPVVMVQHTATAANAKAFVKETHGWELHNSIKDIDVSHCVEKTFPSSFVGTDLEDWLRKNSIDTVVISGYMTQHCCDTTARYAHHLGFNVEFLSDATGTLDFENKAGKASAEEIHRATLVEQQFRFSDVLSTKEWTDKVKV